jgi:transposase
MITERIIFEIHRLHHEGRSLRKIARTLAVSRDTVAKYLAQPERRKPSRPRPSMLDPFKEDIARLLAMDPEASSEVIRQRLAPLGFKGSRSILKDYLRTVRPAKQVKRAFIRYESPPGEQIQIDWGHFGALPYAILPASSTAWP